MRSEKMFGFIPLKRGRKLLSVTFEWMDDRLHKNLWFSVTDSSVFKIAKTELKKYIEVFPAYDITTSFEPPDEIVRSV
jgi:hypothetical protein